MQTSRPKRMRRWQDAAGLTRIFHRVFTSAPQSGMSTALRLFGRLDILSNMSALPARRAPCIYARLRPLGTKRYEISGLTRNAPFKGSVPDEIQDEAIDIICAFFDNPPPATWVVDAARILLGRNADMEARKPL